MDIDLNAAFERARAALIDGRVEAAAPDGLGERPMGAFVAG